MMQSTGGVTVKVFEKSSAKVLLICTRNFSFGRRGSGDLMVQTLVSGTFCIDLTSSGPTYPFNGVLTVKNEGGTGKYAQATGTETLNFTGQQMIGSTEAVGFVTQTETGVVTTP